jgi:hypothetical protein
MLLFSSHSTFYLYAEEKEIKKIEEMRGIIIDNRSLEKYLDDIDRFILRYPKAQAILPISFESGYSIYSEGEIYRFNEESNEKIFEFLQERNNVLRVIVKVEEDEDGELKLISIKNQYIGARGEEED